MKTYVHRQDAKCAKPIGWKTVIMRRGNRLLNPHIGLPWRTWRLGGSFSAHSYQFSRAVSLVKEPCGTRSKPQTPPIKILRAGTIPRARSGAARGSRSGHTAVKAMEAQQASAVRGFAAARGRSRPEARLSLMGVRGCPCCRLFCGLLSWRASRRPWPFPFPRPSRRRRWCGRG